jgi:hypothetical protein
MKKNSYHLCWVTDAGDACGDIVSSENGGLGPRTDS